MAIPRLDRHMSEREASPDVSPRLGTCPRCETLIHTDSLLIWYDPDNGWPRLLAECPECGFPVQPR